MVCLTHGIMRIHKQQSTNPNPPLLSLFQRCLVSLNDNRRETLFSIRVGIDHLNPSFNAIVQFKPAVHRSTDQYPISGLSQRKSKHVAQGGRAAGQEDVFCVNGDIWLKEFVQMGS